MEPRRGAGPTYGCIAVRSAATKSLLFTKMPGRRFRRTDLGFARDRH